MAKPGSITPGSIRHGNTAPTSADFTPLENLWPLEIGKTAHIVVTTGGHVADYTYKVERQEAVSVAAGRFGMIRLLDRLRIWSILLTGDEARWVENWNEPEDLNAAR